MLLSSGIALTLLNRGTVVIVTSATQLLFTCRMAQMW